MIDITVPLCQGMDVWEGDPPYESNQVFTIPKDGYNVSQLSLSSHAGSHIDAPYHYFEDGLSIDNIPLDVLMGECQVISIPDSELVDRRITAESIGSRLVGTRILLKTSNSESPGRFAKDAVAISLEAAELIVSRGVKLIGVDGLSVENATGDGSVHKELLSHNCVVVETLDLSKVDVGCYELICLPMKVIGGDAAPVRAILKPLSL
jgi:arylformamidase